MSALNIFAVSINVIAILACLGMLVRLLLQIPNLQTKTIFGGILCIQILVQSLGIYTYQVNVILRLQNAIWMCTLASCFGQMILNISTIQIFSVLDHRITNDRVKKFYGFILALFSICSIPLIIFFLFDTLVYSMNAIANYMGMVVVISTIIIDESQSAYITYLIFQKGKKLKGFEALVMTILFLLLQIVVDWSAVTLLNFQLSLASQSINRPMRLTLQQIAVGLGSIHFAISVYVYIQFKLLVSVNRKTGVKASKEQLRGSVDILSNGDRKLSPMVECDENFAEIGTPS